MNLGIENKVALITGSSQGIGRAVARGFAKEGARVAVTYRNERAKAQAVAEEIRADGGQASVQFLDLGSYESIARAVENIASHWGQLDILVNNAFQAGSTRMAESPAFEDFAVEEWRRLLRVNIEGVFGLTQRVVPFMQRQKWGRIVNVSSIAAVDGLSFAAWYGTVKAALHGLTRSLSKELGPAGILVNSVMPGFTRTERIRLISDDVLHRVETNSSIRRILETHEVAAFVVFLGSAANGGMTGEVLRVSGGRN